MRAVEILTALPVTHLDMNLGVAGLAKGHQIAFPVVSAFGDGNDMMHLLNGSVPSFLKAPLTQGMRRSIAVADSLPSPTIFLVRVGTACVFVVLLRSKLLMLLAILTALDSQPWATVVSAPAPWSPRHTNHLTFRT